jgi:hypothetical protein
LLLGLNKLTSLDTLADLPHLRELSVTYCIRLKLDRSILQIPALRKLLFFREQGHRPDDDPPPDRGLGPGALRQLRDT